MLFALLVAGLLGQSAIAQNIPASALQNVTIHNADGSVTESATIVWRDGVIEAVGKNARVPFDAYIIDGGDSLHVYPGFIDGMANWGSPERPDNQPRLENPGDPPYDRAGIQPERKPSDLLTEDRNFEAAMKAGFTTAALYPEGFMLPGQVQVFALSPDNTDDGLLSESLALAASFEEAPGGWSSGAYPSTLMGVMAQYRQLMFDAEALSQHIEYYQQNPEMTAPDRDKVLESLFPVLNGEKPLYFSVDSHDNIERLFSLQDQFGFDVVIVSGLEAYQQAEALQERGIPVLASVDVEDAPEWYTESKDKKEDEEAEEELTEEEQQYRDKQIEAWKKLATNIHMLMDEGVKVGYASNGMDLKDLSGKLEVLLDEGGLTEEDLVKMMTVNTAEILGMDASFGSLEEGNNASFSVFDKPMTEEKAKVTHSVSNGTINELN